MVIKDSDSESGRDEDAPGSGMGMSIRRKPKGMYAVYLLQIGLLYFIVTGLLTNDNFRSLWGVGALAITFIPRLLESVSSLRFHWTVKLSITLPLFLHIGGGIEGWYFSYYPWYDKIGHFVAGGAIAFLFFLLFLLFAQSVPLCRNSGFVITFVILITMFLGSCWEIAEQYLDLIYNATYYRDVIDSIFDQIFNLFGACALALLANREMKRYSFDGLFGKFFHAQ